MIPSFEQVSNDPGCSWSWMDLHRDAIPFQWHHHPEYELVLTTNSRGHRYVGDSVEAYGDNDLILTGPNLPHTWQSTQAIDVERPQSVWVVKFSAEWLGGLMGLFPELHGLGPLMAAAPQGVVFSDAASRGVRDDFMALPQHTPERRLLALLDILCRLSRDGDHRTLAAPASQGAGLAQDPRLGRVFSYLHDHYAERIEIATLAEMACVSVSSLHRLFLRSAWLSPLAYVARLRIGRACALLIEGRLKISAIAAEVGYDSLAQFNKEFRRQKGMTPRAFAGTAPFIAERPRPCTPGVVRNSTAPRHIINEISTQSV